MHRHFVVTAVVALGLLATLAGCSQKNSESAPATAGTPVAAQIGLGQLSGHTYTHDHFKLAVTLPEQWYIQSKTEADQLRQAGSTLMKQDANGQAIVQAAQQRTLTLLSSFRHPPGTPVPFNESLMILAENVAFLPGLKLGEDYLKLAQRSMGSMTLKHEFEPIQPGLKIGSHQAARLKTRLVAQDNAISQEYYAARVGDYFLVVILTYGDDAQRDALHVILDSLKAG